MACPPLEKLAELLGGTIEDSDREGIERHLTGGCPLCAENRAWLARIFNLTAKDDSFDFSEDAIRWSVAQFKAASAMESRRPLIASLVFDSLLAPRPADLRSISAAAASRQMLYHAGTYDVDIRIEPADDAETASVIGQILCADKQPAELQGLDARLSVTAKPASAANVFETRTDSRGMFRLFDVRLGEWTLEILVPEGEVRIDGLKVKAP